VPQNERSAFCFTFIHVQLQLLIAQVQT